MCALCYAMNIVRHIRYIQTISLDSRKLIHMPFAMLWMLSSSYSDISPIVMNLFVKNIHLLIQIYHLFFNPNTLNCSGTINCITIRVSVHQSVQILPFLKFIVYVNDDCWNWSETILNYWSNWLTCRSYPMVPWKFFSDDDNNRKLPITKNG